jgi:hypothetical protein
MPYETEPIPPIPFLAELREEVLRRSLKRMPKWKFRLTSDLVFQLQPKPTVLPSEAAIARGFKPKLQHFEGVAVMLESVTGDVFKHLPRYSAGRPWWQIKFELYSDSLDAEWEFKRTGGRWRYGAERAGTATIVHRLIAALRGGLFDGSSPGGCLGAPLFPSEAPGLTFAQRVELALAEAHENFVRGGPMSADAPDDLWSGPNWRAAAVEYHKECGSRVSLVEYNPAELARLRSLLNGRASLERAKAEIQAHHERQRKAASSTIEALMLGLRERGTAALQEPKVLRRLSQLDDQQLRDVAVRLQKLKPHIAPAWTPGEIAVLFAVRGKVHGRKNP